MDENTISWSKLPGRAGKKNQEFAEARDLILERIAKAEEPTKICPDCAETIKGGGKCVPLLRPPLWLSLVSATNEPIGARLLRAPVGTWADGSA